jgi:Resolvase, N terminal domain
MTPFRLSIKALPLMVNNIKFGTLTRMIRTTASMRKHGIAGLKCRAMGKGTPIMIYGYARVSTDGQTLDAQQATLKAAGAEKVFAEKISGAVTDRKALAKAIDALRAGDVLLVTCPRTSDNPRA